MFDTKLFMTAEDNLLKTFDEIHNFIYANDGLSEQQVLDEFVKVLFVKFTDEKNEFQKFSISKEEVAEITSGRKQNDFTKRIEKLFQDTILLFPDLFDNKEKINISAQSLSFIVQKLQRIDFSKSSKDAKGLAFQKFLGRQAKSGRGQFFTPEPIIDFCVEILQPKENETIIDPACGTGGFIFSSLKYIQKNNPSIDLKKYTEENIFGIEINRRISQISKMKFLLECNGNANILCHNSLDDFDILDLHLNKNSETKTLQNTFDIVLTNPPFGTQGKITNSNQLSKYELGYKWNKYDNTYIKSRTLQNGQIPDVLFIERCLQLLKQGGRMGIVLPNGHFENSSMEYIRLYIKAKADVIAVVNLPQETFIPYGTGVKASLLFLQKKNGSEIHSGRVFFSRIEKLGYQGNKNGTPEYIKDKTGKIQIDKTGNKIIDEDFSIVLRDYCVFQKELTINTNNSFSIDNSKLNGRFDYDYYSPKNRGLINILQNNNAVKLSEIATIVKQKSNKLKQNGEVAYVELSDINTHSFEIINTTLQRIHELPSRASYELKEGDIITAVAGNSIGTEKHATAYITKEYEGTICTNGFRILRNLRIDPYYLLYYLKSQMFLKQIFMYRTGAAIPAISDQDLENILIYIPADNELKNISNNVKQSFELRNLAKQKLTEVELNINLTSG